MITIDEIKNITFRQAKRKAGYNGDDVDAFVEDVIEAFEQLKKEKTNLVHKIDVLATRIEQYRADEETVRNALLASQKVSDACIREAKEKAAKIVRDAEAKAQALLVDSNKMTAIEKENYLQLQSDAVNLRNELIELYKKHIQAIGDLPTSVDLETTKQTLNEKYPTEDIVSSSVQDVQSEVSQSVEELLEAELAKAQVQTNTEVVEEKANLFADIPAIQPQKQTNKFAHLKFGDNYDVSAD